MLGLAKQVKSWSKKLKAKLINLNKEGAKKTDLINKNNK